MAARSWSRLDGDTTRRERGTHLGATGLALGCYLWLVFAVPSLVDLAVLLATLMLTAVVLHQNYGQRARIAHLAAQLAQLERALDPGAAEHACYRGDVGESARSAFSAEGELPTCKRSSRPRWGGAESEEPESDHKHRLSSQRHALHADTCASSPDFAAGDSDGMRGRRCGSSACGGHGGGRARDGGMEEALAILARAQQWKQPVSKQRDRAQWVDGSREARAGTGSGPRGMAAGYVGAAGDGHSGRHGLAEAQPEEQASLARPQEVQPQRGLARQQEQQPPEQAGGQRPPEHGRPHPHAEGAPSGPQHGAPLSAALPSTPPPILDSAAERAWASPLPHIACAAGGSFHSDVPAREQLHGRAWPALRAARSVGSPDSVGTRSSSPCAQAQALAPWLGGPAASQPQPPQARQWQRRARSRGAPSQRQPAPARLRFRAIHAPSRAMVVLSDIPPSETVAQLEARIAERARRAPPSASWPDRFALASRQPGVGANGGPGGGGDVAGFGEAGGLGRGNAHAGEKGAFEPAADGGAHVPGESLLWASERAGCAGRGSGRGCDGGARGPAGSLDLEVRPLPREGGQTLRELGFSARRENVVLIVACQND